jgi:hypothetical protein
MLNIWMWTGFSWLRLGINGGLRENNNNDHLGSIKGKRENV